MYPEILFSVLGKNLNPLWSQSDRFERKWSNQESEMNIVADFHFSFLSNHTYLRYHSFTLINVFFVERNNRLEWQLIKIQRKKMMIIAFFIIIIIPKQNWNWKTSPKINVCHSCINAMICHTVTKITMIMMIIAFRLLCHCRQYHHHYHC